MCFSSDGAHLAYTATSDQKAAVVIDGTMSRWYDGIDADRPIFSPDGNRIAYWARQAGRWFVVLDGRELERHDHFLRWSLTFSPDGEQLAYGAIDGQSRTVFLDAVPGPVRDNVALGHPIFSPDSRRIGFVARVDPPAGLSVTVGDRYKRATWIDGELGPAYDWVGAPVFSPDGRRVAYAASTRQLPSLQRQFWVIADGQPHGPYSSLGDGILQFSADGRLVYAAADGDRLRMVTEGVLSESFDDLGPAIMTRDGAHIGYDAKREGKWTMVVDGVSSGPWDGMGEGTPVFSHEGNRVAADAKINGTWRILVDGMVWPDAYDATLQGSPVFTPDDRHVLAGVRSNRSDMVVIDGHAGPAYDTVLPYTGWIRFDGADRFHYIAIRGSTWYLVLEKLD